MHEQWEGAVAGFLPLFTIICKTDSAVKSLARIPSRGLNLSLSVSVCVCRFLFYFIFIFGPGFHWF